MMRLGLVGVGAWGQRYIATLARREDCRIATFARSSPGTDAVIPGLERAEHAESWQALLERASAGELDGIIVATTPESQAELAAAAVTAGVPALVEKPLGLSRAAAARILECVRASKRPPPLVVNYVHRFAPAYRALRARVHDADGGARSVANIEAVGSNRGPFRTFSSLYDYGPHEVALCLDLLGVDAEFRLRRVDRLPAVEHGELFEAHLTLDEVSIVLRVGNGATTKAWLFAVATKRGALLVYDDLKPHPSKLTDDGVSVPVDEAMPLDVAVAEFLGRCQAWHRGESDPERELRAAEFSVRVNEILDAVASAAGAR